MVKNICQFIYDLHSMPDLQLKEIISAGILIKTSCRIISRKCEGIKKVAFATFY